MAEFAQRIPFERLFLLFQPIVNLDHPEQLRYEALIRMNDGSQNLLAPNKFLPALEKSGLMSQLDQWVMRELVSFLEANPMHAAAVDYAAINLSGASINDEKFVDELMRLATEHPEATRKICFEITETVALKDMQSAQRLIDRIHALGARVALDDFGAGYSSFSYLSQLKVDTIKIDGSLIQGITLDRTKQAIVKAIVDISSSVNCTVVAEWIEDAKTLHAVGRLGVHAGQGWALGRPVASSVMAATTLGYEFVKNPDVRALLNLGADGKPVVRKIANSATSPNFEPTAYPS
jgi:EAL domain-containing protein (putative c-di-GMP-specific phosphodiesterase class I)